jgi:hypothetical protein
VSVHSGNKLKQKHMFIPKFGNKKHIDAGKMMARVEAINVLLANNYSGIKKLQQLRTEKEILERNIKHLLQ